LIELSSLDLETQRANAKSSVCDIHHPRSGYRYPRSIEIWWPNPRNPIFDPRPDGSYQQNFAEYADLDGDGRIEAIVQLRQESSQGRGWIFVFEMDDKCVVHRLAQIEGTALDRLRVKGKLLLVDQPRGGSNDGEPVCKQPHVKRFVWQFAGGKLRSTSSDLCEQP